MPTSGPSRGERALQQFEKRRQQRYDDVKADIRRYIREHVFFADFHPDEIEDVVNVLFIGLMREVHPAVFDDVIGFLFPQMVASGGKPITTDDLPELYVGPSPISGDGVFAGVPIPKGTPVGMYTPDLIVLLSDVATTHSMFVHPFSSLLGLRMPSDPKAYTTKFGFVATHHLTPRKSGFWHDHDAYPVTTSYRVMICPLAHGQEVPRNPCVREQDILSRFLYANDAFRGEFDSQFVRNYVAQYPRNNVTVVSTGTAVMFFANREISEGDELTWHYGQVHFTSTVKALSGMCAMPYGDKEYESLQRAAALAQDRFSSSLCLPQRHLSMG